MKIVYSSSRITEPQQVRFSVVYGKKFDSIQPPLPTVESRTAGFSVLYGNGNKKQIKSRPAHFTR